MSNYIGRHDSPTIKPASRTALVVPLPRVCPSISYKPYLQRLGGCTLLEWGIDRLQHANLDYPVFALAFSEMDAEIAAAALRARPITVVRSIFLSKLRSLLYFGKQYSLDTLVIISLEAICLTPLTLVRDICDWHFRSHNTYTPAAGFPEGATVEVINTCVLQALCEITLPPHLQEPRVVVQSLLSANSSLTELPFGLRILPYAPHCKIASEPSRTPLRISFQTPEDVAIMRAVAAKLQHRCKSETNALEHWKQQARRRLQSTPASSGRLRDLIKKWHPTTWDDKILRVLYVSNASAFSGPQRCLLNLVRAVDRNTVEPHVLVGMQGLLSKRLQDCGVHVYCGNREFLSTSIDTMNYLMSIISKVRPNIIHLNSLDGFPIVGLAHVLGIPVVAHVHLETLRDNNNILRSSDIVVAVSEAAKRAAEEVGVGSKQLMKVYNAVECPAEGTILHKKAKMRRMFRLPSEARIALMVARFDENKRQDMLIDAMANLRRHMSAAHAVCVGEAYGYADVAYHDELIKRIDNLGLHDAVTMMGFQSDIFGLAAACDVVVSCSRSEALPTSLLEGMVLGIPVVATRTGGSSEIVRDGETGFLVSEGDVGGLSDRLGELLSNEALRRRMGEAAKRDVSRRFGANTCAREMEAIYARLRDANRD